MTVAVPSHAVGLDTKFIADPVPHRCSPDRLSEVVERSLLDQHLLGILAVWWRNVVGIRCNGCNFDCFDRALGRGGCPGLTQMKQFDLRLQNSCGGGCRAASR